MSSYTDSCCCFRNENVPFVDALLWELQLLIIIQKTTFWPNSQSESTTGIDVNYFTERVCGRQSHLVRLGKVAGRQYGVFGWLQAVRGALGDDDVHGHIAHGVEFLTGEMLRRFLSTKDSINQTKTKEKNQNYGETMEKGSCGHLVYLRIIRTLAVFCLFDVLYHLSYECVTVILIFRHQDLQNKP